MIERAAATLRIGGLTPLSTVDYPGQLAAVVFCQGCPWRCRYCHNTHLQPGHGAARMSWAAVTHLLERRRGLLDAVVFSGGEPTLQAAVAAAMSQVRDMGYRVGLHTAGMAPRRLQRLIPLCDWIALDIKASAARYAQTTGRAGSGERAWESLRLILDSGVDHEIRTTVHPALLPAAALLQLVTTLAQAGVCRYVVQAFRARGCADPALGGTSSYLSEPFVAALVQRMPTIIVRQA